MTTTIVSIHRPTTTLTPKGDAVRLLYRFSRALSALPADDQAAVLALVAAEIRPMIARLAVPS